MTSSWAAVKQTFQEVWGYDDFRPPQEQIIRCLLAREDALVVMPTGAGKSICFQLPAILQQGVTLVISPLVALMENQVQTLRDRGLRAGLIHSQYSRGDRLDTLQALETNRLRLLYLSPETLFNSAVWERLLNPQLQINGLILDEAHCLAQWGESFRPAYSRLGAVRPALLHPRPPGTKMAIAAFTATADCQTQRIIRRSLGLRQPQQFLLSPYRQNLQLTQRRIWTKRGKRQQLNRFLEQQRGQSGLIYVRSRRVAETLAQELSQGGYNTSAYHGGLSGRDRRTMEKAWLENTLQFVVCTSAFGMGIDKADVRWVLHYHCPSLLAEYIQEIGRAGRDGKPSIVMSLVAEPTGFFYPEDRQRLQFFQRELDKTLSRATKLARTLPQTGDIRELASPSVAQSLAILQRIGQLKWCDPFTYQKLSVNVNQSRSLEALKLQHQEHLKQIQQFWPDKGCRWQYLLKSFGFLVQARNFACGHCDRCCPSL